MPLDDPRICQNDRRVPAFPEREGLAATRPLRRKKVGLSADVAKEDTDTVVLSPRVPLRAADTLDPARRRDLDCATAWGWRHAGLPTRCPRGVLVSPDLGVRVCRPLGRVLGLSSVLRMVTRKDISRSVASDTVGRKGHRLRSTVTLNRPSWVQ